MTMPIAQARRAAAVFRQLLRLLPRRSRECYGSELAEVYARLLEDAARNGNSLLLWRQVLGLLFDFGQSLVSEYLDLWRSARLDPHRSGIVLLLASALTWLLIILAAAADQAWAARLLDANVVVTMFLAFGFPAAALGLSRMRLDPYVRAAHLSQLTRTAGAAVLASWSVLFLHLGQTAA